MFRMEVYLQRELMVAFALTLFVLLAGETGAMQVLKGSIKIENVTSGSFGDYLVVYNHQLTNLYEQYHVESELGCRYLAMSQNYIVASVETNYNRIGSALDCRISNSGITQGILLTQKSGTHTYIRELSSEFYPASDGLFYVVKNGNHQTYQDAKRNCPGTATSSLPTTRTSEKKDIVRRIASGAKDKEVYVGVEREAGLVDPFKWYDTNEDFSELKLIGNILALGNQLSYKEDSKYYKKTSSETLDFVCTYKIFDFSWQ